MNETTRAPTPPVTNSTPGADRPQTERSPLSYKSREPHAPADPATGGGARHLVSLGFAVLWLGAVGGYLWGFYGRANAPMPEPSTLALALGVAFVPIFVVAVLVELVGQARRLARLARHLGKAAQRASEVDLEMVEGAAQASQSVRRELDVLSASLDATLARVAAVEDMLDNQVGAIEVAGNQAQQRAHEIRELLQSERVQLASVADELGRSTEVIAQTLGNHIAASRQASLRAEEELRAAEASLTRQAESFTQAAADAGRATTARLDALNSTSQALEETARQSVAAADALSARLNKEHDMLFSAAERLQEMGRELDRVLAQARTLVERAEKSVSGLVQGIGTSLSEAGVRVDAALEGARTRAGEAGRNLRAEAEAAAQAGSSAAQTIEAAAGMARRAAEEMRAAIGGELTALSSALSGGTRSLSDAAQTVARSAGGANDTAQRLVSSIAETLQTVESASKRLFGVLDQIAERSKSARGTLDDASREMEGRLAHLPELAAEHAARLSSLLEDQASRMSALAEALGARGKPAREIPEASLRASLEPPAPIAEPVASETPPLAPKAFADEAPLAPAPAILRAEREEAQSEGPGGAGSVRRFSLLRRRTSAEAVQRAPEAHIGEQEAEGTTGGFWSALFSRIEGEASSERAPASAPSEDEPAQDFESAARAVVEGLHALAIDLDRLLEEEPPMELWKRYRSGERNVFARRLLTLKGQGIEERIRHKYRDDTEFRDHADHYIEHFEELLARARTHDRERVLEDTYLSSHTGRLYQLIKDAVGG